MTDNPIIPGDFKLCNPENNHNIVIIEPKLIFDFILIDYYYFLINDYLVIIFIGV